MTFADLLLDLGRDGYCRPCREQVAAYYVGMVVWGDPQLLVFDRPEVTERVAAETIRGRLRDRECASLAESCTARPSSRRRPDAVWPLPPTLTTAPRGR